MNHGPNLEGLEFLSDNEEEVEPVADSISHTRKRTIDQVEKSPAVALQDGILFIYNQKIIMIILKILIFFTKTCHALVAVWKAWTQVFWTMECGKN